MWCEVLADRGTSGALHISGAHHIRNTGEGRRKKRKGERGENGENGEERRGRGGLGGENGGVERERERREEGGLLIETCFISRSDNLIARRISSSVTAK